MKLYKFYKKDCAPCYVLNRLLTGLELPDGIVLVPMNVGDETILEFAKEKGVDAVPTLMFEDGRKITGVINKTKLFEFLGMS